MNDANTPPSSISTPTKRKRQSLTTADQYFPATNPHTDIVDADSQNGDSLVVTPPTTRMKTRSTSGLLTQQSVSFPSPSPSATPTPKPTPTKRKHAKTSMKSPYFQSPVPSKSPYFLQPPLPTPPPPLVHKQYNWEHVSLQSLSQSPSLQSITPSMYTPLQSPYLLIQERLYRNPWMVLFATIFLNKTSWKIVEDVLWRFFQGEQGGFLTPEACVGASASVIEEIIHPLGMQRKRAVRLIEFSKAFIKNPNFDNPSSLPGIGKYGEDSWRLFCGPVDTHWQGETGERYLSIYTGDPESNNRDKTKNNG
ncbi:Methyl-CpG-binding domain protein 4 [Blyttiomyces sp. JEL0837]|nr:Methyl-CpG-binding domain protein 4 [Blyttiomyces sp. JEL0837]